MLLLGAACGSAPPYSQQFVKGVLTVIAALPSIEVGLRACPGRGVGKCLVALMLQAWAMGCRVPGQRRGAARGPGMHEMETCRPPALGSACGVAGPDARP